jgi:hypothetical protein
VAQVQVRSAAGLPSGVVRVLVRSAVGLPSGVARVRFAAELPSDAVRKQPVVYSAPCTAEYGLLREGFPLDLRLEQPAGAPKLLALAALRALLRQPGFEPTPEDAEPPALPERHYTTAFAPPIAEHHCERRAGKPV